ncbi:expressed unknown protein [Seminavis robusta]|uniref:DUF6824 domain-containing protein n=1 Tax=Seminavis robusta TaxID=568900 RepID=A0A9N8ERV3_9STRA|nr:expressed unknown protein [Seminavis robusta]|eukprot:Sro1430_g271960.1 n/a (505) ;mRNA; r:18289-20078
MKKDKSEIIIKEPRSNDILLGRGGSSIHNPSNVRYRGMVREHKKEYQTFTRLQKTQLAEQLVRTWQDQTPPGRFLEKDDKTGFWHVIPEKLARRKTSQLLREGAPKIRRQLKTESVQKKQQKEEEEAKRRVQSPPPQMVQQPVTASPVPATPVPSQRPYFPPGHSYSVLRSSPVPSHHHHHHYEYNMSYPMTPPPSHYPTPHWPHYPTYQSPSPVTVPPITPAAPTKPGPTSSPALVPLASKQDTVQKTHVTPFTPRPINSSTTRTQSAATPLQPITLADVNQKPKNYKLRKPPAVSRSNSCSSTGSNCSGSKSKSKRGFATIPNRHAGEPWKPVVKPPSPESVLDFFDHADDVLLSDLPSPSLSDLPSPSFTCSDIDDDDDDNARLLVPTSTKFWERTPLEPLHEDQEFCPPVPIRDCMTVREDSISSVLSFPQPFLADCNSNNPTFSFGSSSCLEGPNRSFDSTMDRVVQADSDLDRNAAIDILNELDREMEAEFLLPCHSF